ncbi:MAG: 3-phosphoshikimate 1-carboxyvinyltransferase [Candidatus Eiseniibacteriota bacterium]
MGSELTFAPARALSGTVHVPGDKSLTHRAYLLAAVAEGTSRIEGANDGADCRATLSAVERLGVAVVREARGAVAITGCPEGFASTAARAGEALTLDLGNSGTGLRLLAGLLAGRNVEAVLTGDASLSRRPMARIAAPLTEMGAQVTATGSAQTPPLRVRGTALDGTELAGIRYTSPIASAQVKSCVLLAGLSARGTTWVEEPVRSRDHTERLLPAFGVAVTQPTPTSVRIEGPVTPHASAVAVPGDFSAAAFWLVAGSIVGEGEIVIENVGLNPTRTGALEVLGRMGASIEVVHRRIVGEEPVGDLRVRPASLVATAIAPEEVPGLIDELPVLAIAMACATGQSSVAGAGELRVKESDRIALLVSQLRALGVKVDERPDGFSIDGGPIQGGSVESAGDHRIAMAFGILALAAQAPVRVREAEMIDTSYPSFYIDLRDRVTPR